MAVVFNQNQDKEKDQQGQDQQSSSPVQQTNAGASGDISASALASATPNQQNGSGTSSGRFTNLKSYIDANKNFNKQGGGLAGKVVTNLNNQGQQVTQNVANAVQNFNNQANQQVQAAQSAVPVVQQAVVDPSTFAQNEQNVNTVAQARDAEYTGPKSLMDLTGKENQAALQGQAKDFGTKVQQSQTETGRFNLLRNMFGKPSYSSGQQNLDNLLIQGQKDQLSKLSDARKTSGEVNRSLDANINQAQQTGQQTQQTINNVRNQTRDILNQRVAKENEQIQQALQDAKLKQQAEYDAASQGLSQGYLPSDLLRSYGLQAGTNLYNADLSNTVSMNTAPTAETVANAQNYAQIAALQKLIGNASNEEASKILAQFADPTKAGTYDPNKAVLVDNDAINQRISSAKAAYDNTMNTPATQIKGFTGLSANQVLNVLRGPEGRGYSDLNFASSDPTIQGAIPQLLNYLNTIQRQYGQPEYRLQVNPNNPRQGTIVPVGGSRVLQEKSELPQNYNTDGLAVR